MKLLWLVLGGAALGVGVIAYRARKAAASSGGTGCELACVAAAKAAGMTGDTSALCRSSCGLLEKAGVTQWAGGITDAIGGIGEAKDPRKSVFDTAFGAANGAKCPDGSTLAVGGVLADHRTDAGSYGTCVDASGKPIGTVASDGTFTAYTPTYEAPPPSRAVTTESGATKIGATAISSSSSSGSGWFGGLIGTSTDASRASGGVVTTTTAEAPVPPLTKAISFL